MGPLRLLLDETQLECLQQIIPASALDTILVGSMYEYESVRQLLKNKGLPVPEVGVSDLSPDTQLYDNLPPLKAVGKQLLHSLPPAIANYLIDHFDIQQHSSIKRP